MPRGHVDGRARRGIAIPIVLVFTLVVLIFAVAIMRVRGASKHANLIAFHGMMANLMAQAGIQHALMKIRICPDEAFEAAARQYGMCPLADGITSGTKDETLMNTFIADLDSTHAPADVPAGSGYRVTSIKVKAASRSANKLVTVVEITSEGWATEGRGGLGERREVVQKTVSIFKAG